MPCSTGRRSATSASRTTTRCRRPTWLLARSMGPAGLITASVQDVLAFARMHLDGGLAADGTRVLSAASCEAMAGKEAELPDTHTLGDSWGLGWIRFGWDGERLLGHDGNTIGQSAFLRLLPSQRPRRFAAHERRRHAGSLPRPLPRDLPRGRGDREARAARATRRRPRTSTPSGTSAATSARR